MCIKMDYFDQIWQDPLLKPTYYSEFSKIAVTHEILELLDYAGDECINNRDYEYDMCRQNYIFQVCTLDSTLY